MSSASDERPKLEREDEEFVKRVAASYAPPRMSAARRAAFDEALSRRMRRGQPARRWLAAASLPAAAAATLAVVWLFSGWPGTDGLVPTEEAVSVLSSRAWEEELFLDGGFSEAEQTDESELLPEEYIAIASAFLDG